MLGQRIPKGNEYQNIYPGKFRIRNYLPGKSPPPSGKCRWPSSDFSAAAQSWDQSAGPCSGNRQPSGMVTMDGIQCGLPET